MSAKIRVYYELYIETFDPLSIISDAAACGERELIEHLSKKDVPDWDKVLFIAAIRDKQDIVDFAKEHGV